MVLTTSIHRSARTSRITIRNAPTEWGEGYQENHWTYAKKLIDKARAEGKTVGESVFGVFDK